MGNKRKTFKQGMSQEYVDEETGEVFRQYVVTEQVEGYTDVKLPNKSRFDNGAFITLFQKRIFDIVTNADLNKGEMKLLLYLLATTQIDNSIVIDLNILNEDLKMGKANISRSLKGLTDRNIVIRKDGYRGGNIKCLPMELRVNYDQLNYDLAYNGKIKDYNKNRVLHPEIEAVSLKEIEEKKPNLFNLLKDEK